jgi:hypothetical protein
MNFTKANFRVTGMYLLYVDADGKELFVARFKRNAGERKSFTKFLIENFTFEEYFGALARTGAPLDILRSKGYVSAAQKKAMAYAAKNIA